MVTLFQTNKLITQEVIGKWFNIYTKIASQGQPEFPKSFHCHSFRHARATHWLEDGVNPAQIQRLLGHESIETTMKYVGVSSGQIAKALCFMEDSLTLSIEKKYKKVKKKDSLAAILGLR
ncbi:MAG: tyrosine-type recombinase/integrase [Bacteroides sp.]|nr:tyrosine-type recombinase/integrase [Bacteroides sp.]